MGEGGRLHDEIADILNRSPPTRAGHGDSMCESPERQRRRPLSHCLMPDFGRLLLLALDAGARRSDAPITVRGNGRSASIPPVSRDRVNGGNVPGTAVAAGHAVRKPDGLY